MIQKLNSKFAASIRKAGHTYYLKRSSEIEPNDLEMSIRVPPSDPRKARSIVTFTIPTLGCNGHRPE